MIHFQIRGLEMSGETLFKIFCTLIGALIGVLLGVVIGPFWGFVALGALLGLILSDAEGL